MASKNWGKQRRGMPEKAEHKVLDETLKDRLQKMSMGELRTYVKTHNLKAKDTSKDELINEILTELNLK